MFFMPVIEIKNLTKTYNETMVPVHALNGINLEFEKGRIYGYRGAFRMWQNHSAEYDGRAGSTNFRKCNYRKRRHHHEGTGQH